MRARPTATLPAPLLPRAPGEALPGSVSGEPGKTVPLLTLKHLEHVPNGVAASGAKGVFARELASGVGC